MNLLMTIATIRRHKYFLVDGDISIEPWTETHQRHWLSTSIMIMGPTGAGKSTFIEALVGRSLGISKDQLEGYTQDVSAYRLKNTRNLRSGPVDIIDTPGFSDSKISAMEIIGMVKSWMESHEVSVIEQIFYLCPITDVRLPGTKRRAMEIVKSLTRAGRENEPRGLDDNRGITVVTTMWDKVWNESLRERAEANFSQLKSDIWKEMVDGGTCITRFSNTQSSALQVLDESMENAYHATWNAYNLKRDQCHLRDTPHGRLLYQDLLDRVEAIRQEQRYLMLEVTQPATQFDGELDSLVKSRLKNTRAILRKFEGQLVHFGDPPNELSCVVLQPGEAGEENVHIISDQ